MDQDDGVFPTCGSVNSSSPQHVQWTFTHFWRAAKRSLESGIRTRQKVFLSGTFTPVLLIFLVAILFDATGFLGSSTTVMADEVACAISGVSLQTACGSRAPCIITLNRKDSLFRGTPGLVGHGRKIGYGKGHGHGHIERVFIWNSAFAKK
jgi:hypothetical protein